MLFIKDKSFLVLHAKKFDVGQCMCFVSTQGIGRGIKPPNGSHDWPESGLWGDGGDGEMMTGREEGQQGERELCERSTCMTTEKGMSRGNRVHKEGHTK